MSTQKPVSVALAELAADGIHVEPVWGNDYTLTVDLDTQEAILEFPRRLKAMQQHIEIATVGEWKSRSGGGRHYQIASRRRLGFQTRAALQAFLGSDPLREMLGWFNVNNQREEDPFVLFKPTGGSNG